jgi:hypothetical protein
VSPYREPAASRAPASVRALSEEDPSGTWKLRAWAFSDGTTRVRVRARADGKMLAILSMGSFCLAFMSFMGFVQDEEGSWLVGLIFLVPAAACLWRLMWSIFGGERFSIDRGALVHRRTLMPWRRAEVYLLDEISTIVVSGEGEKERLDLQLGRKRVELCRGVGHHGETLRWIARRLRRAVDDARRARA